MDWGAIPILPGRGKSLKNDKKLWLRDFLPLSKYGKKARIMTLVYDAQVFTLPFSKSQNGPTMVFAEELLNDLSDARVTAEVRTLNCLDIAAIKSRCRKKHALSYFCATRWVESW